MFAGLWLLFMALCLVAIAGVWAILVAFIPPVLIELQAGNIHLPLALAIGLGLRYPATWVFVLLTKPTLGIGLLWFAVRREMAPPGDRARLDRGDRRGRAERDRQLAPFAAHGEPEQADAERRLGEEHEDPGRRVAQPETDGQREQQVDVAGLELDEHGGMNRRGSPTSRRSPRGRGP